MSAGLPKGASACAWPSADGQSDNLAKHTIVGDKLEPKPDRSRCDPPVSFVNLLPQRETGSLTIGAKIRTNLHQVVVGLD